MQKETGGVLAAVGLIQNALGTKGELSLAQLQAATCCKPVAFERAIGWLAREDEIVITRQKQTFRLALKKKQAKAVGAD
jgi:(p)ppGpp synthase/HD superfamily hydrolase